MLQNFDGIFAFAFYDKRKNKLILARDRSGIKPLYIGKSDEGLVYSSQYDHIIHHPYIKDNALNAAAIGAYLSLGYVPENSGVVQQTFMLPHGFYCEVNERGLNIFRFYNYQLKSGARLLKDVGAVIDKNVKDQLVSDVPIGTFMSGGVDSPLVSYYAKKYADLKSFNIGVDDPTIDESASASKYASLFHTDHFSKIITEQDLIKTIEDNTKAFTEPFADYSSIPTLVLSKFAKQQVTVALSGDGGDELFWGYPRNVKMLQKGLAFKKSKARRTFDFITERISGANRNTLYRHLQVDDFPSYYYRSLFITGAEQWVPKVLNSKVEDAFFYKDLVQNANEINIDEAGIMDIVRKMEFDIHLQRILLKVDRASMYHSLEVRVPLLSNEMIDFSTGVTYKDCISNGQGKMNLKNLLIEKSNKELVMQPKKGFIIPLGNWIRKELRKDVEDKLMNMPSELAPLFNQKQIALLLKQHMSGTKDWSWFIWAIYSLVNWHRQYRNV